MIHLTLSVESESKKHAQKKYHIDTRQSLKQVMTSLCQEYWLIMARKYADILPRPISLIVYDFDGVFTDNRVWVNQDGSESVACNRGDSLGINELKKHSVDQFILSTESNCVVQARSNKIGLKCYFGCKDKLNFIRSYVLDNEIDFKDVVYVGNDVNDVGCMNVVGCAVCPSDAHPEVIALSDIVLNSRGGCGAVREFCDLIVQVGKLHEV